GPLHGQAIAGKLGLRPPTISHHLAKLKEIDIVYQRRDKNTIYFYLNRDKLRKMAIEIIRIGDEGMFENFDITDEEKSNIIRSFIDDIGKLTALSALRIQKVVLVTYM